MWGYCPHSHCHVLAFFGFEDTLCERQSPVPESSRRIFSQNLRSPDMLVTGGSGDHPILHTYIEGNSLQLGFNLQRVDAQDNFRLELSSFQDVIGNELGYHAFTLSLSDTRVLLSRSLENKEWEVVDANPTHAQVTAERKSVVLLETSLLTGLTVFLLALFAAGFVVGTRTFSARKAAASTSPTSLLD